MAHSAVCKVEAPTSSGRTGRVGNQAPSHQAKCGSRVGAGLLTLVLALVACGGPGASAPRATLPPSSQAPARDLASAKPQRADPSAAPDPRVIDLDTIRIQVVGQTPTGEPELAAVATADLFNEASAAWKQGQGDVAIGLFRRLATEFPESSYAPLALYNIAAIYDRRRDLSATIAVLRELIAAHPTARKAIEARLFLAALLAEHKRWAESVAELEAALASSSLTFSDRVEALARKGYALIELARLDDAEVALAAAVDQWRRAVRLEDPYFVAMAQYYRGVVTHRRFQAIKVALPDDNLGVSLNAKSLLAAAAYDRWREALGHRHAYWATAAGYQMSQIFFELWEAAVLAPYPTSMSREARPHYVVEVHQRVREHLLKSIEGHRMNLELASAYGVTTSWSDASRAQLAKVQEIIDRESRGIYLEPAP